MDLAAGGGQVGAHAQQVEGDVARRQHAAIDGRDGAAAGQLHQFGDGAGAVVLDAGTTVEALAELMLSRDNHLEGGQEQLVITHALHIAAKLADAEGVGLELVGGRIRKLTWAATGSRAAQHYDQLRPDLAFVGCNGAHARFGLSTPDPIEAVVKSAIVTAARRVVVLCDASKQDQETLTRFCSLEQIDTFITDRAPMGDLAQALEDADVEVVVA